METMVRGTDLPLVVSLFSGAGGLDLGFKQAGFNIAVAFDVDVAAIQTHKRNFPNTTAWVADLNLLQPRGVVERVCSVIPPGGVIGVIGGPPCQGFSRANTSSQTNDPRNHLPELYMNVVAELQKTYKVEFIVFENVLGMRTQKHVGTLDRLKTGIRTCGFGIDDKVLCASSFGVPQKRQRILLAGLHGRENVWGFEPQPTKGPQTVYEAIAGVAEPVFFKRGLKTEDIPVHPNHWTMQPKSRRFSDPEANSGHGRSMKRLRWDSLSPTIAFGHREIHVHPNGHRRLSIYEAMKLQGFPESFVLEGNLSQQVQQISNAVPPPLALAVAKAVKDQLVEACRA